MTTKTLPPLAASDFDMRWDADRVFPFVESEDALIMAHGHQDPAAFTTTVHEYDVLCVGGEAEKHHESDVQHLWAVHIDRGDGGQDGWWMSWSGVTSETPNAFPITIRRSRSCTSTTATSLRRAIPGFRSACPRGRMPPTCPGASGVAATRAVGASTRRMPLTARPNRSTADVER